MEKKRRVALSWRLDVFGLGFGGFGIYLEVLLYSWTRLLPCDWFDVLEGVLDALAIGLLGGA